MTGGDGVGGVDETVRMLPGVDLGSCPGNLLDGNGYVLDVGVETEEIRGETQRELFD